MAEFRPIGDVVAPTIARVLAANREAAERLRDEAVRAGRDGEAAWIERGRLEDRRL